MADIPTASPWPFIECPDCFCLHSFITEAKRHIWSPDNIIVDYTRPTEKKSIRNPWRWDVIEVYVTTKDINQGNPPFYAGTPFGSCMNDIHMSTRGKFCPTVSFGRSDNGIQTPRDSHTWDIRCSSEQTCDNVILIVNLLKIIMCHLACISINVCNYAFICFEMNQWMIN